MKIYLLILISILALQSQSKFRYLRNLSIATTSAPSITFISADSLAYQDKNIINVYNIPQKKIEQTFISDSQPNMQPLPTQQQIIYKHSNTLYQMTSLQGQIQVNFARTQANWILPISVFNNTVAVHQYVNSTQPRTVFLVTPTENHLIQWNGIGKQNIQGSSGISLVNNEEYYFASGGICDDSGNGQIYALKGNKDSIKNVFNVTLQNCDFGDNNKKWQFQSVDLGTERFHLITYANLQQSPRSFTSELFLEVQGNYDDILHFQIERMIGVNVISSKSILTADNLLCRVLQHNPVNHQHEHKASIFRYRPTQKFTSPSQNWIVAVGLIPNNTYACATLYRVDQNSNMMQAMIYATMADIVRSQIYNDSHIFYTQSTEKREFIGYLLAGGDPLKTGIDNVIDFCISQSAIFIVTQENNIQVLSTYYAEDSILQFITNASLLYSVSSISCLDNGNVLLNPVDAEQIQIWQLVDSSLEFKSQMLKDKSIHSSFNWVQNILIFTHSNNNSSKFYDYTFKQQTQTFNLRKNSIYSIVSTFKGKLVLAVGDDLIHFVSLQSYAVEGGVITYSGTYPYLDHGQADITNIFLFPQKNALHLQFESTFERWSTIFGLDNAPQMAYGYFYDDVDLNNACDDYDSALFQVTQSKRYMFVLKNGDIPSIYKYEITGSQLTKIESYALPNFISAYLQLKISRDNTKIIISGVNKNLDAQIQIRDINLLYTVIYSGSYFNIKDSQYIRGVDYSNNKIITIFNNVNPDKNSIEVIFKANSKNPIAVGNNFDTVSVFATCFNCDLIAFTGQTATQSSTQIVIQNVKVTSNKQIVQAQCVPTLLALSTDGSKLAWNCQTNTLWVYDVLQKTSKQLPVAFKAISSLSFLDNANIIANLNGVLQKIPIASTFKIIDLPNANSNLYAIDYTKQIYVVVTDFSTITIYDFQSTQIDTFTLSNQDQVSSLSFDSAGQLYIATVNGLIISLTEQGCLQTQFLQNNYCVCKYLFVTVGEGCACNLVLSGNQCGCNDGEYHDGVSSCNSCSFMCSTCSQDGFLSCDNFGVWFFVIIISIVLIIAGIAVFVGFKLKRKQKQQSLFTQEKSRNDSEGPLIPKQESKLEKD